MKVDLVRAALTAWCCYLVSGHLQAQAVSDVEPLSVCEILTSRRSFDRKLLTVTGRYGFGEHGAQLSDSSREQCPGKANWPAAIEIVARITADTSPDYGAGAEVLLEGEIERYRELRRQYAVPPPGARYVEVVFEGEVLASRRAKIKRMRSVPWPAYRGSGYGFNGQFPAALSLRRVVRWRFVGGDDATPQSSDPGRDTVPR